MMHSGDEETDLLEGAMLKRGGFFSGWKERLFVLTNRRLQYHIDSSRSSAVKGDILLNDIKSVDSLPEKKHGKRFCLAISGPQETWVVRAETETDFSRWRDAIRNAIAGERQRPAQPAVVETPAPQPPRSRVHSATPTATTDGPPRSSEKKTKERIVVQAKIEDNYSFGRVIDIGSNGKVLEGLDKRSGDRVAIKQIDVGASIEDEGQLEIWQQVQHENVVRLLDFYKTPSQLYFVMELAMGKDLFYGVMQHYHHDKPRGFSERDAMELTSQLMSALRHLHLRRIVHCDLKPENILLHEDNGRVKLKLADWGYAQVLAPGRPLERVLGTGSYMAPEVLATQPYDEKVDLWSAGVIFFVLLCGFPPYEAMYDSREVLDLAATLEMVRNQSPRGVWSYFPSPYWDRVSREGRHYIQALLTLDPAKRLSAEQSLKHPWYQKFSANTKTTPRQAADSPLSGMLEQMGQYNASRARNVIEHCLGGVLHHTRSGAAMAAAAVIGGEEEQGHILEEEGWQPLISLAWSSNATDRRVAAMALANVTQSKSQGQRLVREGGLRVLLEVLLEQRGGRGGGGGGGGGGGEAGSEETVHYAAMALANLAAIEATREPLVRHQAHRQLVAISRRESTACRYQAGRALARLCRDDRWQVQLVADGALEAVLELATQGLFESVQEEALRALQALGRHENLAERVIGELKKELHGRKKRVNDKLWALLQELEGKGAGEGEMLNSLTLSDTSDKDKFSGNDPHTPKTPSTEVVGLEGGLEALEPVEPEVVLHGSSGTVRKMKVRGAWQEVAVKFVPLEVHEGERKALLAEISMNYSCGDGGQGGAGGGAHMIGFFGAFYEERGRGLGIVMEWVKGGHLSELYRAHKAPLPEDAVRSVLQQAAAALQFMHSRHLIHRDVKPSSLLIDVEGLVKVTNLGNLRRLAKTTGQAASVVGTTCYFAPERIVGVAFSNSVDIWGLGLTALEAAIAEFPFKGYQHNYMALLEHIVDCECPVNRHSSLLSARLRTLLARCLQKQAKDRPSAADLLQDPFLLAKSPDAARAALRATAQASFAAAHGNGARKRSQ